MSGIFGDAAVGGRWELARPDDVPGGGTNLCQPCIVRAPAGGIGTYYLYAASHAKGDVANRVQQLRVFYTAAPSIRESLAARWVYHPSAGVTLGAVEALGGAGHDAANAHIGSPSVLRTGAGLEMWLHVHAGAPLGHTTAYATSTDGLTWTVSGVTQNGADGIYLAAFRHGGAVYAVEETGALRRSDNGVAGFRRQGEAETFRAALKAPLAAGQSIRHAGVEVVGGQLEVYYTVRGDAPERIFMAKCPMVGDWQSWACGPPREVVRPETQFDGADLPLAPSASGHATARQRELRDPAPFTDADGSRWLAYAAAGESGIGITNL